MVWDVQHRLVDMSMPQCGPLFCPTDCIVDDRNKYYNTNMKDGQCHDGRLNKAIKVTVISPDFNDQEKDLPRQ